MPEIGSGDFVPFKFFEKRRSEGGKIFFLYENLGFLLGKLGFLAGRVYGGRSGGLYGVRAPSFVLIPRLVQASRSQDREISEPDPTIFPARSQTWIFLWEKGCFLVNF